MSPLGVIVSHHWLRRRARSVARELNQERAVGITYVVEPASRGRCRWVVRRKAIVPYH